MKYGLSDKTLGTLNSVFNKYPGVKQVVLYGSRVKGKYRKGSDIDMSIKTSDNFSRRDLLNIVGDFDDSDIPYLVDVSIYENISNPDLRAQIDKEGKVLYAIDTI